MSCTVRDITKNQDKGCLASGSKKYMYIVQTKDIDSFTELDAALYPTVFTGITLKVNKNAFRIEGLNNSHNLVDAFERGVAIGTNTKTINYFALNVSPEIKNEIDIMARDQIELTVFFFDGKGRCHLAGRQTGLSLQSYNSDSSNTDYGNAYNIVLDASNTEGIVEDFGDYTKDVDDSLIDSTYAGTEALLEALLPA